MSSQHLSDEAIAAFADGVLSGHARERASRHAANCPECAHAVAVQREAAWALRAAPAPSLPSGLLDRLRSVPATTPIEHVPAALGQDGSAMFAAFGTMMMPSAALAPSPPAAPSTSAPPAAPALRTHRIRPIVMTAAAVATAGVLAVGSAASAGGNSSEPARQRTGGTVDFVQHLGGSPTIVPAGVHTSIGP
ncbi:MAG: zf-HC2 domain-containing protein [Actinomycetota bacterium]|nr:zf-HC2 domain-containing protein [Actinomycetota bacterium]